MKSTCAVLVESRRQSESAPPFTGFSINFIPSWASKREAVARSTGLSSQPKRVEPTDSADFQLPTNGAESAAQYARLKQFYGQAEEYGAAGIKQLENGRFRFYGELDPADVPGEMVGRVKVREWDPVTGNKRTWFETSDQQGTVRIVRPETGGTEGSLYF